MSVVPGAVPGSPTRVVTVEHWFDFICPYCYVAQDRNRIFREHGIHVVEHALQIHPEIGPGGTPAGSRSGPAYEFLAREAEAAGLPLRWTDRMVTVLVPPARTPRRVTHMFRPRSRPRHRLAADLPPPAWRVREPVEHPAHRADHATGIPVSRSIRLGRMG
jgi:hypothetical protein